MDEKQYRFRKKSVELRRLDSNIKVMATSADVTFQVKDSIDIHLDLDIDLSDARELAEFFESAASNIRWALDRRHESKKLK